MKFNKFLWIVFLFLPSLTLAANGVDAPTLFEQGTAFLRAQTYQLALDRFYLAGELSRDDAERAEALRWTGEAYLRDKHYDLAYQDFLTALRLDPLSDNASSTELKSAIALVYAENYTASLEHLNNLEKKNKDIEPLSDIYFWEAECYYQTGKYPEALKLYETILRQNPRYRHTLLVNYLVDWCYFQQKDFDNAYEGFKALSEKPVNHNLQKLASFQVAECQFWRRNYSAAQAAYAQFTKTYQGDDMVVAAYYGWGWALAKQDRHSQAVEIFKKIVTDFPQNALAPWAAVREGAEDYAGNDYDSARKDYEEGLKMCSGKSPADFLEYGLGWLDYSQKNYDDAVVQFQKVERFGQQSPLYWNAVYLRAGCLYLQAKYDEAQKTYQEITDPASKELVQDATYWEGWCDYAIGHYDFALKQFIFVSQNTEGEPQTRGFWGAAESSYQLAEYAKAENYYEQAIKNDPSDELAADCYSGLGWSKFQQEKYEEAIKSFEKTVEKAPGSPLEAEALLRIADSYYNLHNYEKASENYKRALTKDIGAKAIDAKEQLGWCAYRQEDFTQAVSLWSALIKNDDAASRKSKLLYWTAWAYFRNKDFKNARQLFGQVESDYPNDSLAPEAHLREGDCYFNLQQFKDAKDMYQSFVDRYPTHVLLPDALYGLQWSAEKLGLKDEASQVARNFLEKFPDSAFAPSIQYRLADNFYQNKKYADAVDTYKLLLEKYPGSLEAPKSMFWMAMALLKDEKKPEAIAAFNNFVAKYPNDPLTLEGEFSLGSLYYDAGDFKNALDHYSRVFKTDPKQHLAAHALFDSAVCENQLDDKDKALEYYAKLVNDYSNDPLAADASLQSGILYEKLNQNDKALKAYELTISKSKDQSLAAEAAFYHADIYKTTGQYEKAMDEFNALIVRYPDQDQWVVTAYAKVAECYETQKKYKEAEKAYQRILKYTKVKVYRDATNKRLKALQPFLHNSKKTVRHSKSSTATPEVAK